MLLGVEPSDHHIFLSFIFINSLDLPLPIIFTSDGPLVQVQVLVGNEGARRRNQLGAPAAVLGNTHHSPTLNISTSPLCLFSNFNVVCSSPLLLRTRTVGIEGEGAPLFWECLEWVLDGVTREQGMVELV